MVMELYKNSIRTMVFYDEKLLQSANVVVVPENQYML